MQSGIILRFNISNNFAKLQIFHRDERLVINGSWINCVRLPTAIPMWYFFQYNYCWVALCTQLLVGPTEHKAIVAVCVSGLNAGVGYTVC